MKSPRRFKLILTAVAFLMIALYVFSIGTGPDREPGPCKKAVLEAVAPLEGAINGVFDTVMEAWRRYVFLVGLEVENRRLRGQVSSLSRELNDYREMGFECLRLRSILDLKRNFSTSTVVARVVGEVRPSVFKIVLIDKGAADGIGAGDPVIAVEGVVGRVIESSWHVSKVLLLIDYNSNIDALIQRNRVQGIVQGLGQFGCNLKYVQRSEDVFEGDAVVTSGLAGVFPKGLYIGSVTIVEKEEAGLFQKIRVTPAIDVSRLEEVLVITGEEKR